MTTSTRNFGIVNIVYRITTTGIFSYRNIVEINNTCLIIKNYIFKQ